MPGPVAHVVYAQKIYPLLSPTADKADFIRGTLFPDIRALKVIDREKTHLTDVTYDQIKLESDPFRRGFLLHSLIDEVREAFVESRNAYRDLPSSYLSTVALKICEDMILYDKVDNWQEYIAYLDDPTAQEIQFGVPESAIRIWHQLHREFFANPPEKNIRIFLRGIGFTELEVAEITKRTEKIRESRVVDTYLYDFYDNLEALLKTK